MWRGRGGFVLDVEGAVVAARKGLRPSAIPDMTAGARRRNLKLQTPSFREPSTSKVQLRNIGLGASPGVDETNKIGDAVEVVPAGGIWDAVERVLTGACSGGFFLGRVLGVV